MKKICVITGSRAEYGLLRSTLKEISKSKILSLRLIATASHLSQEYGYTIDQIKKDKIKISKEIAKQTDTILLKNLFFFFIEI